MRPPRARLPAVLCLWALAIPAAGETTPRAHTLPLFADWFVERGIDLPKPFGVGAAVIHMNRDVEIDDVRVRFGDRPPESISDRADFDVRNATTLATTRVDAWVLPFLNVYGMLGYTESEAALRTVIRVPTPGPGGPVETEVGVDSDVSGLLYGAGMTAVVGYGSWFAMADANYGESELDGFDGKLDVWLYSGRFGHVFDRGRRQLMAWAGLMYIDSERTISIPLELPIVGATTIDVDQRPTDPLTYQLGASLTLDRRWQFLAEFGSNLDDAHLLVGSLTYRF
jgi:hypothetical protein